MTKHVIPFSFDFFSCSCEMILNLVKSGDIEEKQIKSIFEIQEINKIHPHSIKHRKQKYPFTIGSQSRDIVISSYFNIIQRFAFSQTLKKRKK